MINLFWGKVEKRMEELGYDSWASLRAAIALKFGENLASSTVSNWISEDRFPPADRAVMIAKVLETTVESLVIWKKAQWLPPADIVEDLKVLNDVKLNAIREILKSMAEQARREKENTDQVHS